MGPRPGLTVGAGCLGLVVGTVAPVVIPLAVVGALLQGVAGGTRAQGASASRWAGVLPPGGAPSTAPLICAGLVAARGFQPPIHGGIDLDCPEGTPVRAVAAGTVHERDDREGSCPFAGVRSAGYGLLVTIDVDGGGTQHLYGHLSSFAVPPAARVEAGDVIGQEGSTGCSTGPHLHFEVREDGRAVNPCPHLPASYPSAEVQRAGCPLHL